MSRAIRVAVIGLCLVLTTCSSSSPGNAAAYKIGSRSQLIGGQRALGEVGDYKISNGIIHAIVQEVGRSRGPGAFGGSLIDVDLVRGGRNTGSSVVGNDMFTEMFPAFFLQAVEPSKVEVIADGGDGGPATIRVTGQGGDFVSLVKNINNLVLPSGGLNYQVDYILEPGKQYLKIVTTVINPSNTTPASFTLAVPFGFVTLMGEGQNLFVPGLAGFDMRFHLEDVYKRPSSLDALPGEVTSMIATQGDGVSYALAADERGANYLRGKATFYPTAKRDSMLIPVAAGAFLGTFWGQPPVTLEGGKSYSYTGYLAVGTGDVASAQRVIQELKETPTGKIAGIVREAGTNTPIVGATVVVQNAKGEYISSAKTLTGGRYFAQVEPGRYRAFAHASDRNATVSTTVLDEYVEVEKGGAVQVDLTLERPAVLSVTVVDETGRPLPAKISVEGIYDYAGTDPARSFLYNLKIGERRRYVDLTPDTEGDPQTRRYLERVFFAVQGRATASLRANPPGRPYKVYASRGVEYDLASQEVELVPGQNKEVALVVRRVMPTPGWLSGDFHVHSINSVDSYMGLEERVASYAVEGVDYLASTDHNYVTDLSPTVEALRLRDWVKTVVGLELTTIEMGHFNAYPLQYQAGPVNHGSFDWFHRPPSDLFAGLRALGKPNGVHPVVQVNHPRDGILGYFNGFNLGSYTGTVIPPVNSFHLDLSEGSPYAPDQFSFDFDVLEVFSGKHFEQLFHYRIPADPGPGKEPAMTIPDVGEILEQTVRVPLVSNPTRPEDYREQAQPAFPGALEDYYMLLAKGLEYTAVGNSDSHSAQAEAGLPRTYLQVGDVADGSMSEVTDEAVVGAMLAHRGVVTNGPFVEMWINDRPIGSRVYAQDGVIRVKLKVQAAPWVDVKQIVLKQGSPAMNKLPNVLAVIQVPQIDAVLRYENELTFTGIPDRSFIVAEVSGEKDLWPVFTPYEIASIELNDAVGSLAGSFGFEDKFGKYRPQKVRTVQPFAFTNPIWIDREVRQMLKKVPRVQALVPGPHKATKIPNLTKLFESLHGF